MASDDFTDWVGRTNVQTQRLDAWPVRGLRAATSNDVEVTEGSELPPLTQWFYFAPWVPHTRIGIDGHPQRGAFLPPITLPRRMWAGSDITYGEPMKIGDVVEKTERIAAISEKQGKSGTLIFVTVEQRYTVGSRHALTETQTLVYRDHPQSDEAPAQPKPAPTDPAWSRRIRTDTALLFRYSAITFNAHRIHYDQPYATGEEGYPSVVVHGQLTATFMLDEFMRQYPGQRPKNFSFRAAKPIFCGDSFFVEGAPREESHALWARDEQGNLCMSGSVRI